MQSTRQVVHDQLRRPLAAMIQAGGVHTNDTITAPCIMDEITLHAGQGTIAYQPRTEVRGLRVAMRSQSYGLAK